ncbi:MAG: bifunctional enoyl-CoA hydratase/phosphate acetyltransferase [Chlorobi bacterium]|nr:bifunctional enoyl-CoA hydratase/phosphate acetyltransferase [Chlorobiota bacterium]
MLKKLKDLNNLIGNQSKKRVLALAVAHDHHALDAAYKAMKKNVVDLILTGDENEINSLAKMYNYNLKGIKIINEKDKIKAVEIAVKLVNSGDADILMKGNVSTAILLKGVLNKEWGLRSGELLSHFALFEIDAYHKLIALTDVAMNILPDLKAKVAILNNSVNYLNKLGIAIPKVAIIGAVEIVNENMPATTDAALLSKMAQRKQIQNCIVDGPLAFDNAISRESAKLKGIDSEVAGDADLLLLPEINSGNVLYKSFVAFAKAKVASVILGAKAPIVLTSRADTEESKLNSILLAAAT